MTGVRRPMSMRLRLIVSIGLAVAAAFAVFTVILMQSVSEHFTEMDLLRLEQLRINAERTVALDVADDKSLREALAYLSSQNADAALIVKADGIEFFRSAAAPAAHCLVTAEADWRKRAGSGVKPVFEIPAESAGETWRVLKTVKSDTFLGKPVTWEIYSLMPINVHLHYLSAFRTNILIFAVLFCLAVFAVIYLAVRSSQKPLEELSRKTAEIDPENLDLQLCEKSVPVELVGFVAAFNRMLKRIAEVIRREQHFSADIAHELRTPVTNLTVQAEVALSKERSTEELENVLYSSLEEYRRMSRMIDDMLFLARVDNAVVLPKPETFALKADVLALTDFLEDWADEKGVTFAVTGPEVRITGDRLMIRRAVTNLLTNAVGHTHKGGTVSVALEDFIFGITPWVRVTVKNKGAPIPEDKIAHVFERFFRADPARSRTDGGTGIGLAMVESIARVHGGRVWVRSDAEATVFAFEMPQNAAGRTAASIGE